MKYSPSDLTEMFGQSKETIRQWSLTFKPFLSPTASSNLKGQRRFYDENDLEVFALIADMKARSITYDEITLALANGERGEPPIQSSALVPQAEVQSLQLRISGLQSEINKRDGRIEELREQLATTQDRLEKLLVENALLKANKEQG